MQCLVCPLLLSEFAEAMTSYSMAADRVAQVTGIDCKQPFSEVHDIARQEFETCGGPHDALDRNGSAVHLRQNIPKTSSRRDWWASIPSQI